MARWYRDMKYRQNKNEESTNMKIYASMVKEEGVLQPQRESFMTMLSKV